MYLTAIGWPPGGSCCSMHMHINNTGNVTKQTIHRTTQKYIEQHKKYIGQHINQEECGPCPVFAGFILAFALKLRKKHGKTSVKVVIHKHTVRIHCHNNKNTYITLLNGNKPIYTLIKYYNLKNMKDIDRYYARNNYKLLQIPNMSYNLAYEKLPCYISRIALNMSTA
jgi:hypothetical protein